MLPRDVEKGTLHRIWSLESAVRRPTMWFGSRPSFYQDRVIRRPFARSCPMHTTPGTRDVDSCQRCAMFSDRLLSIFEMMTAHERSGGERGVLCSVAKEIIGVNAASIALTVDDTSLIGFCASDVMARSLVDLELMVREGPCTQSIETDVVVSCADLVAQKSDWMLFEPEAIALGLRSS